MSSRCVCRHQSAPSGLCVRLDLIGRGTGACRWFAAEAVETPEAQYLDIILYSRDQLVKEHEAMPSKGKADALPHAPWGIISLKAQDEDHETPMQVPSCEKYQPTLIFLQIAS